MQIFSTLPTHFSLHTKKNTFYRGFTLVELLVSIAIIGIVTGIVIAKYSSFDSGALLKNTAYEIASTLREAQVKSVSAARGYGNSFEFPYGVTFVPDSNQYVVFQYASSTGLYPQFGDTSYPSLPQAISTTTIGRTMKVDDICATISGIQYCNASSSPYNFTRLSISFRRPDFNALFLARAGSGATYSTTISDAKIIVSSTNNAADRYIVKVSALGQITVQKE